MIEEAEGPSSGAVCRECGERRDFLNDFKRLKSTWMRQRGSPDEHLA